RAKIRETTEDYPFVLNGVQLHAAGTFDKTNPTQPVTIYTNNTTPATVAGTAVHEIEHAKWHNALSRYNAEEGAAYLEPVPPPSPAGTTDWEREGGYRAIMDGTGTLRPPYDTKYPAYTAFHAAFASVDKDRFANSDGVTDYSREYWKRYQGAQND